MFKYNVALFTMLLVVVLFGADPELNKPAPDFKLIDSNGKEQQLSEYKGKLVVLEWVNFGCPFVKKHYNSSNMQELQKTYTGKDVIWLSICSSAPGKQGHFSAKAVSQLVKEKDASPTAYLMDEKGKVGRLYGAKTTPHMLVINRQGILKYNGAIDNIRSVDVADIKKAENFVAPILDKLIKNESVSGYKTDPYGCSVKY